MTWQFSNTCKSEAMWTFSSFIHLFSSEGEQSFLLFSLKRIGSSMENEYGVNIVSLEMDRDAEASGESGHTVESSRGDADAKKMDECGGWTNERHNSYLEYLENSFVKQFYSLLGGEERRRLSRARDLQSNSHKSTDQFTVLKNGCRQKVNFGKKRPRLETSSSRQTPENPNGIDIHVNEEIENSGGDKSFTRTSVTTSLRHEYPAQSTAEASGQNFREEVGEKGCNSRASRKRRREANYDDSSLNDQVVP
ncbi:cold-regulated protein 28 isoform X2 [Brassica napus]|uniref:cold-regulated protein 28 isoform X2 n=1 Tax=Brassica napus TaxID=3708 RepID=UPI002079DBCB|nr:cold-regulated protein 28 isoform X2 [Brassica napus]